MSHYTYKAELVRVIDGDTVELDVDLGFKVKLRLKCRLQGIDCPERGSDFYKASTNALTNLLESYKPLVVQTNKDRTGKFGRYLVTIWGRDSIGEININKQMIRDGHAVRMVVK